MKVEGENIYFLLLGKKRGKCFFHQKSRYENATLELLTVAFGNLDLNLDLDFKLIDLKSIDLKSILQIQAF